MSPYDLHIPALPPVQTQVEEVEAPRLGVGGIRCVDESWLTFSNSYATIGAVVGGAGWYLYRLARGPEGGCFNIRGRVRSSRSTNA